MDDPRLQLIRDFVEDNKVKLVPIAACTVMGGLLYLCRKKLFGYCTRENELQDDNSLKSGILDIPAMTRTFIWDYLSYRDRLKLRLVCHDIKADVDTLVGVAGYLRWNHESFPFFRKITLTKCVLLDARETLDDATLLASPYHLKHLSISELRPTPLGTLRNILQDCKNLQKLKMKFFTEEGAAVPIEFLSRTILEALRTKLKLKEFQFIKIPAQRRIHKIFLNGNAELNFPVTKLLTYAEIQLPDVPATHLADWKYFLEQQSKLSTIIMDLGGVHWNFFSDIISRNSSTLNYICLYHLKCFNEMYDDVSTPFDWGIFRNCHMLKRLRVTGFSRLDFRNMESVNFNEFPCGELTELAIKRVNLSGNDVRRIYEEMPHLNAVLFENIGAEGQAAITEMAIQLQLDELERSFQEWQENLRNDNLWLIFICLCGVMSACLSIYLVAQGQSIQAPTESFE